MLSHLSTIDNILEMQNMEKDVNYDRMTTSTLREFLFLEGFSFVPGRYRSVPNDKSKETFINHDGTWDMRVKIIISTV